LALPTVDYDPPMDISAAPTRLRTLPSWLLNQASLQGNRIVGRALDEVGAHRSHYALLTALDEDGSDSQVSLGRRIGLDRSDMVALVNALEAAGFVRRSPDPADRRRNVIAITAAGRRRRQVLERRIELATDDLLAPLAERDRRELLRLLTAIVDHHSRPDPAAAS
jgi:MarR family transcriptional regulator, lower aerobic nicotinate degradation pathway regulator